MAPDSGFFRSSVGAKVTMAVTGVLLFGFVVAHLLGNLQLFLGSKALADYAALLHGKPALLWAVRAGLLGVVLVHVVTGLRLAAANRRARPVPYVVAATVQASLASRSMVLTGASLLVFVIYHLLHFTCGVVHTADVARRSQAFDGHDVHAMVTASFGHPGIALAYALAQIVLFLHLQHGLQSFAQTLGLQHPQWTLRIRRLAVATALAIAGGNALLALSVQVGLVATA